MKHKQGYFGNKVFLLTGASSGIGAALAEKLLSSGARVVLMARSADRLQKLAESYPDKALAVPGDVARAEDCQKAVAEAVTSFGGLDGLIHNAGVTMRAKAMDTEFAVYQRLIEINYYSMVYLFQAAVEPLQQSRGHLVAVSSMMGKYATQFRSGYAASKHALQGFLDSVRLELADSGVHVMVVNPGFVKTNISVNALSGDGSAYGQMDEATEKGLLPEDVADQVLSGMERRKRDLYPAGAKEKLGFRLSRWAPRFLDRILLKQSVT